jgi:hypothetical protein
VFLSGTTGGDTNTAFLFEPTSTTVFANVQGNDGVGLNSGYWTESEFNVFGEFDGAEAIFPKGTSFTVQTLTELSMNSVSAPTHCDGDTSFTGETNNLYTHTCWTVPGGIQFTEDSTPPPPPWSVLYPSGVIFNPYGWIDQIDGGPGEPGPLSWFTFTDTSQVLSVSGTTVSNVTSNFLPSALSTLAGVAAGTADMLVGDDVAEGFMQGTTPNAVVVVDHGTTTVQGALSIVNGRVQGSSVTPIGAALDPPDRRAYDAYDATLYSLHVASTGVTLTNVDVAAALVGGTHVTTTRLVGVMPEAPLAFVWNRFTKMLYVVDVASVGGQKVLRLLTIDPASGRGRELWRTDDMGRGAPSAAYLSVSFNGEVVLALADEKPGDARRAEWPIWRRGRADEGILGNSEVVLLNATGAPQLSVDTLGKLIDAPQAVAAGVNMPVSMTTTGLGDDVGMRVGLIPRRDMRPGICGAWWLATHATGALARDARACPR